MQAGRGRLTDRRSRDRGLKGTRYSGRYARRDSPPAAPAVELAGLAQPGGRQQRVSGPGMLVTLAFSIPGGAAFVALIESGLNFLASTTHSAGLAIIIFTILIKLLLTPLT